MDHLVASVMIYSGANTFLCSHKGLFTLEFIIIGRSVGGSEVCDLDVDRVSKNDNSFYKTKAGEKSREGHSSCTS